MPPQRHAAAHSGQAPRLALRGLTGIARSAVLAAALAVGGAATAQDMCKPREAVAEGCVSGDVLPRSSVTRAAGAGIAAAHYFGPTREYRHGILGDDIEARSLSIQPSGASFCDQVHAGPGRVFEDTSPRLADITGGGQAEAVVVATDAQLGARLEVWGYASRGCGPQHDIRLLAATPYIGRSNRWLAPAAIADLDDDGRIEVAYVDRPHLAKVLRIWRYDGGAFTEVAAFDGVTNHRIGEDFISGGLRSCDGRPEIVVASANWTRLLVLSFDGTTVAARDLGRWSAAGAEMVLTTCAR